jgi:hypothetical protein
MTIAKTIAEKFIERSEALGYKGKQRDKAALDFFCGAAAALDEDGGSKLGGVIMLISIRGYLGLLEVLKAKDEED